MREIKFRAWDRKFKRMFDVYSVCWDDDRIFDIEGRDKDLAVICLTGYPDVILMQYTGLKDKNGKEIYDGDIVKHPERPYHLSEESGWETWTKDVVDLQPPRLWLRRESMGYEGEELVDPEDSEVIGNIYENPELVGE